MAVLLVVYLCVDKFKFSYASTVYASGEAAICETSQEKTCFSHMMRNAAKGPLRS